MYGLEERERKGCLDCDSCCEPYSKCASDLALSAISHLHGTRTTRLSDISTQERDKDKKASVSKYIELLSSTGVLIKRLTAPVKSCSMKSLKSKLQYSTQNLRSHAKK